MAKVRAHEERIVANKRKPIADPTRSVEKQSQNVYVHFVGNRRQLQLTSKHFEVLKKENHKNNRRVHKMTPTQDKILPKLAFGKG